MGKTIIYNNNLIDIFNNETINLRNAKTEDVLKKVLEGKNLNFRIVDNVIIIEPEIKNQNTQKTTSLFQSIKGIVYDIETNNPLVGANVMLLESNPPKGAATDLNGNYKIENVPLNRYNIQISFVGYDPVIISEVMVTTGKEVVINTGLKQSVLQMSDVTVKAYSKKEQTPEYNGICKVQDHSLLKKPGGMRAGWMILHVWHPHLQVLP